MLTGYRTLIVAAIWLVYELVAVVSPGVERPDQGTVERAVDAILALLGPVAMIVMRLVTRTPVGKPPGGAE